MKRPQNAVHAGWATLLYVILQGPSFLPSCGYLCPLRCCILWCAWTWAISRLPSPWLVGEKSRKAESAHFFYINDMEEGQTISSNILLTRTLSHDNTSELSGCVAYIQLEFLLLWKKGKTDLGTNYVVCHRRLKQSGSEARPPRSTSHAFITFIHYVTL